MNTQEDRVHGTINRYHQHFRHGSQLNHLKKFEIIGHMKKKSGISNRELEKIVERSSQLEGYSFVKAKKNLSLIKLLKTHGRAFAL